MLATLSRLVSAETEKQSEQVRRTARVTGQPLPALVAVFSGGRPVCAAVSPPEMALGREQLAEVGIIDAQVSRAHVRVRHDGEAWHIEDLGSRNGTWVDGMPLLGPLRAPAPRVLRIGSTLLVFKTQAPRAARVRTAPGGLIIGPILRERMDDITSIAQSRSCLHLTGETGVGKEAAARHFHDSSSRRSGPFVGVNCASVPPLLAERLLFGARKGAYSGADGHVEGYLQAANGGTLFLDEVAEIDLGVQAKLLRVLQTGEVYALGASRPVRVDVAICSATHRDLRADVASERFRSDLYYRIGEPAIVLPPLRERLEDLPHVVCKELSRVSESLRPVHCLLEAMLTRPWPGNFRELVLATAEAGRLALSRDECNVAAEHLTHRLGRSLIPAQPDANEPVRGPITREALEDALRRHGGNVSRTARSLGVHRTSLRRWMRHHGVQAGGESAHGRISGPRMRLLSSNHFGARQTA